VKVLDFTPDAFMRIISLETIATCEGHPVPYEMWIAGGAPSSILHGESPKDYDVYLYVDFDALPSPELPVTVQVPDHKPFTLNVKGPMIDVHGAKALYFGYNNSDGVVLSPVPRPNSNWPAPVQVIVKTVNVPPIMTFDWSHRWFMWNHIEGLLSIPEALQDIIDGKTSLINCEYHRAASSLIRYVDHSHRYRISASPEDLDELYLNMDAHARPRFPTDIIPSFGGRNASKLKALSQQEHLWLSRFLRDRFKKYEMSEVAGDLIPVSSFPRWLINHRPYYLGPLMQDVVRRITPDTKAGVPVVSSDPCHRGPSSWWNTLVGYTIPWVQLRESLDHTHLIAIGHNNLPKRPALDELAKDLGVRIDTKGVCAPVPVISVLDMSIPSSKQSIHVCPMGAGYVVAVDRR